MTRRYAISHEFLVLMTAEAVILVAISWIDWILVNDVILASNTSPLAPVLSAYWQALEIIKWAIIIPSVALVWLLKRDLFETRPIPVARPTTPEPNTRISKLEFGSVNHRIYTLLIFRAVLET